MGGKRAGNLHVATDVSWNEDLYYASPNMVLNIIAVSVAIEIDTYSEDEKVFVMFLAVKELVRFVPSRELRRWWRDNPAPLLCTLCSYIIPIYGRGWERDFIFR